MTNELLCPECFTAVRVFEGTGYDEYTWCPSCEKWVRHARQ